MASVASGTCSVFYNGIQGVLKSWTALQLAVANSFAGPHSKEKAQWLVGVIETFFKDNAALEAYEVEDFLEEILSNEFNILAEDNSVKEIANMLCQLYQMVHEGKHDKIKELMQSLPCVNLGDCLSAEPVESKDNDMVIDENFTDLHVDNKDSANEISGTSNKSMNKNKPDDDGWVHVTHKKR